ncbi:MAG: pyruvate formate-lyase-activating protein [Bacteroidales bacterium]|jgi:pyruvate formate lyase activating enzyme|nr:pyruvate formate-lyase-activating protein [Bacteroidales bacterium]
MKDLRVHSIESLGTQDGPGIRLVYFLQGCKFKCLYCHNPDTIPMEGGLTYKIEHLMKRAINMKSYFGKTGGITVSGGEPLLQSEQLIPLFKRFKEEGIHTNIDTNGRVLNQHTKVLLDDYADLVMLDIKHIDPIWHKKLTGMNNEATLHFAEYRENSGKAMWLRYVLVPGWSDQEEHLHALGQHFKEYKTIERIELLPYHKLGVHKWKEMGWKYELAEVPENTEEQVQKAASILSQYFEVVKVK